MPEAYSLISTDDRNYARPRFPAKVFRKGKPNGFSRPLPFLYTISLKLPSPLKEGATYTIRFVGVNTSQATVAYVHKPRQTRSIAVHAIQTGYRPDDPYKRAYLSFWMGVDQDGKNGSCTPDVNAFELVDAAGKTVFTGKAELAKNAGEEEQICIHEKLDYTKAAVRRLDFSTFKTPGELSRVRPRHRAERAVPHCRRRVGEAVQGRHAGDLGAAAGNRPGAARLCLYAANVHSIPTTALSSIS